MRYSSLAKYTGVRKPSHTQATVFPTFGNVFIDAGFVDKRWKSFNRNYIGFVLAVEATTLQMDAVPIKTKETESFYAALREIITGDNIKCIRVILSDRESAVYSRHFRTRIRNDYNVNIEYLTRKSKAYLAESMIRWVKVALGKSVAIKEAKGLPNPKRWLETLPQIVGRFNAKRARGTSFRRLAITRDNYYDFLSELWGVPDATHKFNVLGGHLAGDIIQNPRWKKALFPLSLGQCVLVSRKAAPANLRPTFIKPSLQGSYLQTVFVVAGQVLKLSQKGEYYTPGVSCFLWL